MRIPPPQVPDLLTAIRSDVEDCTRAVCTPLHLLEPGKMSTAEYRKECTWQERPLLKRWARTIGSWGGVRTSAEIKKLVGLEDTLVVVEGRKKPVKIYAKQFYAFQKSHDLSTTPRAWYHPGELGFHQWVLANAAYSFLVLDGLGVATTASHLGILPVEVKMYVSIVTRILLEDERYDPGLSNDEVLTLLDRLIWFWGDHKLPELIDDAVRACTLVVC